LALGVAGLLLSSGYSWITNEYGFGIDNILSAGKLSLVHFEHRRANSDADIVLPNGTFATVSETQDPDVFFALQGGVNNFGIVTTFTIRAYPVGKVWGGTIMYSPDQLEALIDATAEYTAKSSHPKSGLATQFFGMNGTTAGAASA
jgi:FAD/FMN-containing dehydrogenase